VRDALAQLSVTGRRPTRGDVRCIVLGHLTRMVVWELCGDWDGARPVAEKIAAVRERMQSYGDPDQLVRRAPPPEPSADLPLFSPLRSPVVEDEVRDVVSF